MKAADVAPARNGLTCPYPELLAFGLQVCVPFGSMDGTTAAARLAEYARAHPAAVICQVEGIWHAWLPTECGGEEFHGRDEAGLLAKLPG